MIVKKILNIVLINKVKYEKLYKFIINWEKPTYDAAESPKKTQICKQENNLKEFEYKLIKYVIKQNNIAFNPKKEFDIKSTNSPNKNASSGLIFSID